MKLSAGKICQLIPTRCVNAAHIGLLTGTLAFAMSAPAQQQDSESLENPVRYEVEVVVFRHLDQSRNTAEIPPPDSLIKDSPLDLNPFQTGDEIPIFSDTRPGSDYSPESQPNNLPRSPTIGFLLLPLEPEFPEFVPSASENYQLRSVWARLTRLDAYQPLLHVSWIQPARRAAVATPFTVVTGADNGAEVDGTVTLYKERYLHVDIDLEFIAEQQAVGTGVESDFTQPPGRLSGDPWSTTGRAGPLITLPKHKLQESRRIKGSAVHYFDHPLFGVIATVREVPELIIVEADAAEAG
jgi:hypothetical protein